MLSSLTLTIPENIYIKDPQSSKLGRRILEFSIILIDKIGIEGFTFKKLALEIQSNESSIYRYFENKHMLMLYLVSWYWGWLEYKLVFSTNNLTDKKEVLCRAISAITENPKKDESFGFIDEVALHQIIIHEYSKIFQTKDVDEENQNGYFIIYRRLIDRLSQLILDYNSDFKFPKMLANTILQGALKHNFLNQHFPHLTDNNQQNCEHIKIYFQTLTFKLLD
ncbi:TetR/AcrR family transcriptional regulator [Mesonia aquimarina]|uniref:TetR/AcrR family transcriptional regulator n=1 Tax=Mesonia aquimarina TaxID=1504967 RepID=UPI000EF5B842|nr:TetR/AcrR family transcriptional regulator [Mesonia aquimarina]